MNDVIWDTIRGSELDVSWGLSTQNLARQIRTGVIKNLDVTGTADAEVLNKAFDVITTLVPFGSIHPHGGTLQFNRLVFRPVGNRSDVLRFEMVYGTGSFTGNSAYLLRYSTVMQSYTTRFLPGAGRSQRLACSDITYDAGGGQMRTVKANSIAMNLLRPIRTVSITTIQTGVPESGDDSFVGLVNDATWLGKGPGYWLTTAYETDISFYAGYYQASATAMTKGNENWLEVGTLVDPGTGLPVKISEATLSGMLATYSYGVRPGPGFVVVGAYQTANFTALFGGGG